MRLPVIPWTKWVLTCSGHFAWPACLLALLIGSSGCQGDRGQGLPGAGAEREVRVAAAADLRFAFDELAAEFQKKNPGIKVTVSYGSSGTFYAQLANHAPFDLYLSADLDYPRKLIDGGLAVKESEFVYAVGHLVVWVPNGSKLDVDKLGLKAVTDPSVKKLAIANPRHAPYGRAAEAALKKAGVYDAVKDRLVLGENIAQAAQFVESGAADVGILALSLALAPAMKDKGRYWTVPLDAYPRLEQGGVILSWAKDREAAQALRAFVTSKEGRGVLKQYGFLPGE
jgi:molybdate transport system substrate-binding protein